MIEKATSIKLGKLIQTLRKERQLTQKQLAERASVNWRTLQNWEQGKALFAIDFVKLCFALEVDIDVFKEFSAEK